MPGYTDANVMEIVAVVAMYCLTKFFDNVLDPEKDFPAVTRAGGVMCERDAKAQMHSGKDS
jgi:hypothetical protein